MKTIGQMLCEVKHNDTAKLLFKKSEPIDANTQYAHESMKFPHLKYLFLLIFIIFQSDG